MQLNSSLIYSLLILLLSCGDSTPDDSVPAEDGITRILMIGNSHTYYNDMPDMLVAIGESYGKEIEMTSIALAGAAFKNHVELEGNQAEIQSQEWDYVVLQENAAVAARPLDIASIEMHPHAETLVSWVKTNHQPSRVYYYFTHAYSVGAQWCDEDPTVCDFDGMLDAIRSNYIALDDTTPASVAPAGVAWKILFNELSGIELHDSDTIHPNALGSYVSARTIYNSLFQESLTDVTYRPESIDEATAQSIYPFINSLVLDEQPNWRSY